MENLYSHVQALAESSQLSQIQNSCERFLSSCGVNYFKYLWRPPAFFLSQSAVSIFNCPDVKLEEFACDERGVERFDPKERYCQHHTQPLQWSFESIEQLIRHNDLHKSDQKFWQQTLDLGIGHGTTIPIRGIGGSRGMFCVAFENRDVDEQSLEPILRSWSLYLQDCVEQLIVPPQLTSPLSERESEILKWTVQGKTADEISTILAISENTVLFHIRNLYKKLNVSNKHHMVAKALALDVCSI